uniref:Na+/H+ antiporter NhaA n=2 Tax=Gelidibacter sp. TaxID=2018083 RepID=UPI00404B7B3A
MSAKKIKRILLSPFEKFVSIESSSGILLFAVTILALAWANSPWAASYETLWQHPLGFSFGDFQLIKPLILWINDGLMAIFFFLIGLEVKREILIGELNTLKKASLPIFAALGGIVVPVGLFLLLNNNPNTFDGWGVPMATDIAFSLAILTVLGKRIPLALKIFLTALAIVDDIAAVLTIAVFYSENINWMLIAYTLIPFAVLVFLLYRQIYSKYITILFGIIIWVLFLKSGIHPTIAGILIAFTIPLSQKIGLKSTIDQLEGIVEDLDNAKEKELPILSKEQVYALDDLQDWTTKVQSPLQHIEHGLHGWVAFVIIPIFAFANAGVSFSSNADINTTLALNLGLALVFGKSIGIALFTFLSTKLGLSKLPVNINFKQIIGVGFLGGIGFTMSIFIANLAFPNAAALIDASKIGIIIGSVVAGMLGYVILRVVK